MPSVRKITSLPSQLSPARRRWFILAAALAPVLALLAVEFGLRLAGHYRTTAYWIKTEKPGEWMPNPQFASQFVGPSLARMPRAIRVSDQPPTNTVRILVFGESAAVGDPEPAFAVSRFLEALLVARLPGRRIEVINTAVTALNSHAIREVAEDSRRLKADFWIVYAGNNEVVGPFGPATFPSGRLPSLALIRLGTALRQTALGQLLTDRQATSADGLALTQRWTGLEQFLDRPVAANDPRLAVTQEYYGANLRDVVKAGIKSGAQVILGSMAVNLVDSPPFRSASMPETNSSSYKDWAKAAEAGRMADQQGAWDESTAAWAEAARQQPGHAETCYRLGLARLNAGQFAAGRQDLEHARDLDTLRFRADSGINQVTREVAAGFPSERVGFVDADRELVGSDTNRPPGADLFLEHVHLRPEGNYVLAKLFGEQILRRLGNPPGPKGWLSLDACLDRLGWSPFAEARLWSQVRTLTERPPFSKQSNAELRNRFLDDRLNESNLAARRLGLGPAIERVQAVVNHHPDDWPLREQLARLLQANRQWSNAVTELQQVVALAPTHVVGWYQLGESFVKAGNLNAAQAAYGKALAIRPDFVEARLGLALAQGESGKFPAALESLDTVLKYSPGNLQAQVNRGIVLDRIGRTDEAVVQLQKAATDHPSAVLPLIRLGDMRSARKDYSAAIQAYSEAVQREPNNPALNHRLAVEFSRAGRMAEAVPAFRQALRLQPKLVDAHVDLGVALAQQARFSEAIPEFEAALQLQPTNQLALKYLDLAREKLNESAVR